MTAAPDDRNRMTLLKNGITQFTSPPEPHPISALQLNIGSIQLMSAEGVVFNSCQLQGKYLTHVSCRGSIQLMSAAGVVFNSCQLQG